LGAGAVGAFLPEVLQALGLISSTGVGAVVAAMAAICIAMLALVGVPLIECFIDAVMKTDDGDGWYWAWDFAEIRLLWWRIGPSWKMSFGRWRDWAWTIFITFAGGGGNFFALHCMT